MSESTPNATASSDACVADLQKYISCFNQADEGRIRECLDENIEIFVDGALTFQNLDTVLPFYRKDFELGKQVSIASKPVIVKEDDYQVTLRVTLKATTKTEATCVDVTYTYDKNTMRQIRHEIFVKSDTVKETNGPDVSIGGNRAALKSWDAFMEYDKAYLKKLAELRKTNEPYANLAFGNPQDPPLPELIAALGRPIENAKLPSSMEYKLSHPTTINAIVKSLLKTRSLQVQPDDILLTNGALSALNMTLFALTDFGDQVLLMTPKYFFYEPMAEYNGLEAILVPTKEDFDIDVNSIRDSITSRTRVILLNSPNNPTGKIYSPESLQALSAMLEKENESRRQEGANPIVVVSDEAYSRVLFDGVHYYSIVEYYPYSIMIYTWAKTLLCPSERFGYICLSPLMPETCRQVLRDKLFRTQLIGWSFPNGTTMQAYAEVADLEVDMACLQQRRDRLYDALTDDGWTVSKPQGGFYMLVQACRELFCDDYDLLDMLLQQRVLALPGSIMAIPGWVRLSLTASDEMVEFAIEAFRRVRAQRVSSQSDLSS